MKRTELALALALIIASPVFAQNVFVANDADHPIPITGSSGSGGDASAANQTAVQANAGSDASKAISVQGITSGKAMPVSMSAVPTGAATAAKQPALGTAGTASTDVITVQGIASGTAQPVSMAAVPTGASTAAKQPALGTAGTASTDVITVQGIASGTVMPVSAASLPLPSGASTNVGATNAANSQVATSTAPATLAIARATRRFCTIKNMDASITVYVGAATVSAANGMPIKAGESMNFYGVGLIQVLSASATPTVAIYDYYD